MSTEANTGLVVLQIVGAAAGLLILGGLWTPVAGVLAGHRRGVDRFEPTRNSVVGPHLGNPGH